MPKTPRSFAVAFPDAALADLQARLARTRLPDAPAEPGWRYGANQARLARTRLPDAPAEPGWRKSCLEGDLQKTVLQQEYDLNAIQQEAEALLGLPGQTPSEE